MLLTSSSHRCLQAAKSALLGAALLFAIPHAQAHADTIADLFNTGVDNTGALLNPLDLDTHYTQNSGDSDTPNTYVSTWTGYAPSLVSNYITLEQGDGSGLNGGNWIIPFHTTFTLPANVNLASVSIVGASSEDNVLDDILINGQSTGITAADFSNFTSFTLPTGFYQAGVNTLDFVLENQGAPGAINVYFTDQSFTAGPAAATPEPGSVGLLTGLSVTGIGLAIRRKRRR